MKWFNRLSHNRFLDQETQMIFDFAKGSKVPSGFGWLGSNGKVKEENGTHLWITSRMLHVFSIAALMGRADALELVDHGITSLLDGPLVDKKNGGWYACVENESGAVKNPSKEGYQHFFVLLGAASACCTEHPRSRELLDKAIDVIEKYFFSEKEQMCLESWNEAFTETESYRGGNANMHAVEAFLIVYDVTGDIKWLKRATHIAEVIIHQVARNQHYRVNEHFDENWNTLPDYNKETPAQQFRAYGGTPGHWVEWGRLMCHVKAAYEARCMKAPEWLLEDAIGVFEAGVRDAWSVDGAPGFVYSVDWDGNPVIHNRIRWPIIEAMGTCYALYENTANPRYEKLYQEFWDYCMKYLRDHENGESWFQELDRNNKPTSLVWDGKQDVYHLLHALLVPRLPLAPGLAPGVAAGLLDSKAK